MQKISHNAIAKRICAALIVILGGAYPNILLHSYPLECGE